MWASYQTDGWAYPMCASLQKMTSPLAVRSPPMTQALDPSHCGTGRSASISWTSAEMPEMSVMDPLGEGTSAEAVTGIGAINESQRAGGPGVRDAGEPVRSEGQVRHVGRIEVLLHPIEDGLGLQVDGKTVRHEACGAIDVVGVERLRVLASSSYSRGVAVLFDEAVDAGEVGGHAVLDALGAVGEEFRGDAVGRLAHAEGAQILIVGAPCLLPAGRASSRTCPAQQVHLPEAFHAWT